tara:strand:- start:397 stop:912 length:516 start_codon:yes stop_codon:yes gene_type:complete
MSEKLVKTAFLSIGSNLGNRKKNINIAKFKLEKNKINVIKSSNNYETLSWPNKKNPKFINVVLKVKTTLTAYELMKKCLQIENELGRKRTIGKKYLPRTCDIDIIDYDRLILKGINNHNLILPHPKMHIRSFVILPLFEIAKTWIHPLKKISVKELLNSLDIKELRAIKLV